MRALRKTVCLWAPALFLLSGLLSGYWAQQSAKPLSLPGARPDRAAVSKFVTQHCSSCHDGDVKKGGLDLDALRAEDVDAHPKEWEKVVRKLAARQMPPLGKPRPNERTYESFVADLEAELDRVAAARPDPGRTPTLRRLNRTEYQNAIRDLLALNIDAATLLPADEANHGFDSAPLGDLSPTLLDRYLSAAQKISRLAVGKAPSSPSSDTFRIPPDRTQESHVEGLPLGTRGGLLIPYTAPQDGEYDIQVWLTRDRNEHVEGLREPHELEVLVDRKRMAAFTVKPPEKGEGHDKVDAKLKVRIAVTAGPHDLGVTFLQNPPDVLETKRQPYEAHWNLHRHPRPSPAIYQVTITGPYNAKGHGTTSSRQRIFSCQPIPLTLPSPPAEGEGKTKTPSPPPGGEGKTKIPSPPGGGEGRVRGSTDEEACAKRILTDLLRRAYRRPVTPADLEKAMKFYRQGRKEGDFDAGIEMALSAILVNPQFLFRVEREPKALAPKTAYRVADIDLASRLSFFLWSSIPDDELLDLAARNELHQPEVFEKQVRRMLADKRSSNLATNFAAQWLYLRNLESITPDLRLFPDFDDNLRKAFRQETELFVESVFQDDRSVLDLLQADYTFLNERLAKHYGIPHVYGSRFRRVELGADRQRGGLLRQGSILTVTSYATRTSPVLRGKWILENMLGSPPPPPPANVPALKETTVATSLPIRERLAEHRSNASCASCHRLIDPVGFALEQFDAVGRWRMMDEGKPVDASGGLPDGSDFEGVDGLEKALLRRPELFVRTLTEKLFIFALGRVPEESDAPAIRKIVRDARANHYRFSSLIVGLTTSVPFQMRRSQ
jgi:mono/diheme cytochrome c family protein